MLTKHVCGVFHSQKAVATISVLLLTTMQMSAVALTLYPLTAHRAKSVRVLGTLVLIVKHVKSVTDLGLIRKEPGT